MFRRIGALSAVLPLALLFVFPRTFADGEAKIIRVS